MLFPADAASAKSEGAMLVVDEDGRRDRWVVNCLQTLLLPLLVVLVANDDVMMRRTGRKVWKGSELSIACLSPRGRHLFFPSGRLGRGLPEGGEARVCVRSETRRGLKRAFPRCLPQSRPKTACTA